MSEEHKEQLEHDRAFVIADNSHSSADSRLELPGLQIADNRRRVGHKKCSLPPYLLPDGVSPVIGKVRPWMSLEFVLISLLLQRAAARVFSQQPHGSDCANSKERLGTKKY